ncbi:Glycosyltransferase involved in cell wall bisynthesis [Abditibacterium utsteinense]|uniref:Glycosyltransferase involved in cell wall bisynthesis n=1 Tax=Abditibacterium utsteinense TaxID=1960156 RepID=A0A2S8SNW6_9BACT|nr:glycosyltransferase [Abditibacterium utsteinense]PQV62480.1 Glycosyltransferase involved in cell wall bisynthesis [Abditibacterium utsteinense]
MQVVQATSYTGVKQGGPSIVTPALSAILVKQGIEIEVIGQIWPNDQPVDWPESIAPQTIVTTDLSGFGYSKSLKRPLKDAVKQADLTHSHGLWMYLTYLCGSLTRAFHKPHVITLHGMIEPWILARSPKKKSLVRRLYQDRVLTNASCLHALCDPEAQHLRELGFRTPIAVLPNGIKLDDFATLPPQDTLSKRFPILEGRKVILFLSRVHPKKGLLHLIEAWSQLSLEFDSWQLVIAGPDNLGHRAEVEQAIEAHNLANQVTFMGTVNGTEKLAVLSAANIFVLPSFSEGFSMAILEAMACRLPVLLTPGCNFSEAVQAGAATEVTPDAQSVQNGLRHLLELTDSDRLEMGQKGYNLVKANYTWDQVGKDMIDVYQWCLGGGKPPASIRLPK